MRFRAVFFDLDDTLHDLDGVYRDAVAVAARHAARLWPGLAPEDLVDAYFACEGAAWGRLIAGETDKERYRYELFAVPLRQLLHREPEAAAVDELGELRRREMDAGWRIFPDALPCLSRLHGRVLLACLTNGPADNKWTRMASLGLDRFFTPELVFISETVGWHKPDRRFFDHVLAALRLPAEAVLMVGDNPATDVAGAQGAGICAAWLNRAGKQWPEALPPPAYTLHSLDELPPILGL